jgi:hypothetical protein
MKKINLVIFMIVALSFSYSCSGQTEKKNENATVVSETGNIEVVYFHYTRRCATCKIVESTTNDAVIELYGTKIPFAAYNLDTPEGKQKSEEIGVSGQALLVVNGEKKVNIINEGFMFARTNPEKYKQVISEKVASLL